MRSARLLAALVAVGVSSVSCGPPCVDDRCSTKAPTPQVTRVDYTRPNSSGTVTTGSGSGSAAPVVAAGSAAGSATPPPAAGSAAPIAAGSGSAAPKPPAPEPVPTSAFWELYAGNTFKMYVVSKSPFAAGAKLTFELVKTPTKTPFVITLEILGNGPEGVWNDCPENKIRCDSPGMKSHTVKKSGQVMLQAGINWTVTSIADEAKGTLVTWTNNLSRELVQLRLAR